MPAFIDDLAAAVDALGPEHVGIVWGIALTDWESAEQRDQFLKAIKSQPGG